MGPSCHIGQKINATGGPAGYCRRWPMVRVLVADDHDVVRQGVARLLGEAGFTVVDTAASGTELADLALRQAADVCVLDLGMPGSGMELIGRLLRLQPRLRILLNLVSNAVQAMPDGGVLEIELGETELSVQGGAEPDSVRLIVRDNGVGMDAETRSRVFEPFYTTRERTIGTDLGLATLYGIVTSLGGTIDVTSAPGEGTTFGVVLPRLADDGSS
jgi:signal transduction histidine kinase